MRAVVQRVAEARVRVGDRVVGEIGCGLMVLVGVANGDTAADARYLAEKIPVLRVFQGPNGKGMDRSVADIGGKILVVSQFTLYGETRGQRRPSFTGAASPTDAKPLYESFVSALRAAGVPVETGEFQAAMQIDLVNDGPVTLVMESRKQ